MNVYMGNLGQEYLSTMNFTTEIEQCTNSQHGYNPIGKACREPVERLTAGRLH